MPALHLIQNQTDPRLLPKPIDYAVLPSDGKSIRSRNSAQLARKTMVNDDGRMRKTKNGIWEISEKGRKWLREHS